MNLWRTPKLCVPAVLCVAFALAFAAGSDRGLRRGHETRVDWAAGLDEDALL